MTDLPVFRGLAPSTSPARQFFDQHVGYLFRGEIDALMQEQYTEDTVSTSNFGVLDTPPPYIFHGREEMKEYLSRWGAKYGESEWDFQFWLETENSIVFLATMTNPSGSWAVNEIWHVVGGFPDGKIDLHYGSGYKFK